ncbi:hypothetical protein, partial [Enterobacter hormaechei]|uniref:hypothetical protein n=1 Tax=Enterobacter hormaechei TaxID=158836 RepID=UPI0023E3BCDE
TKILMLFMQFPIVILKGYLLKKLKLTFTWLQTFSMLLRLKIDLTLITSSILLVKKSQFSTLVQTEGVRHANVPWMIDLLDVNKYQTLMKTKLC